MHAVENTNQQLHAKGPKATRGVPPSWQSEESAQVQRCSTDAGIPEWRSCRGFLQVDGAGRGVR